jgi:hypothetical protein
MPMAAGRRLAAAFPHSRFIETPDSRTLIPIDQPRALAGASPPSSPPTEPMPAAMPPAPAELGSGLFDDPGEEPAP